MKSKIVLLILSLTIVGNVSAQEVKNEKLNLLLEKLEKKVDSKIEKDKERKNKKHFAPITNNDLAKLPVPFKSIKIGKKVVVYATLYEPILNEKSVPDIEISKKSLEDKISDSLIGGIDNLQSQNKNREVKINNLRYNIRKIRLNLGSEFSGWKVVRLRSHYVMYENIESKKTVKKYF